MKVQALSLWQPWATLLAHGKKKVETRTWCYPVGSSRLPQVVAIHATKGWGRGMTEEDFHLVCREPLYREALTECGYTHPEDLPRGCVVGLGLLEDCVSAEDLTTLACWSGLMTERERAFGGFSPGRFGWVFSRVRRFGAPIPYQGAQGIWYWETPEACDGWITRVMEAA